ncbi:MAG TPA: GIY-YIG nuclease family protein [bacterium]|nr:GIY-YIG nuclease family protein [bacterium]
MYYVYLLVSEKNNKSYVGFTHKSVDERLIEHNSGTNSFTKALRPWKLVYYEQFTCKDCAIAREKFFKTGVGKKLRKILVDNF